jgi:uncharacterized membrane protein YeaQ/YmgE (transglycosylase-associated protein family)
MKAVCAASHITNNSIVHAACSTRIDSRASRISAMPCKQSAERSRPYIRKDDDDAPAHAPFAPHLRNGRALRIVHSAGNGEKNMNEVSILAAIVIGIAAGWIAEQVMGRRHGLLTNLLVGVAGAFLGAFVASAMGIAFAGFWGSLLVSALGAMLLLLIVSMFRRRPSA